jgi:hypothetical protein
MGLEKMNDAPVDRDGGVVLSPDWAGDSSSRAVYRVHRDTRSQVTFARARHPRR